MAFSFFRKREDQPPQKRPAAKTPARQPSSAAPDGRPAAPPPKGPGKPNGRGEFEMEPMHTVANIEVSHGESGISQVAEEAAILYANGRIEEAIDTLLTGIAETDAVYYNLDAWFMLFDLFQVEGIKEEFDRLALDFVVQFERSAPAWVEPKQAGQAPPPKPSGPKVVTLAGEIGDKLAAEIEGLEKMAGKARHVRVDLAQATGVSVTGARMLQDAFVRLRKNGTRVVLVNAAGLEQRIAQQIQDPALGREARPLWLILLELLQVDGRQDDFENLSIDYAVAFELSPPSWEALPPLDGEDAVDGADGAAGVADPDAFRLDGVLVGTTLPQLRAINDFAVNRKRVVLDFSGVKRVDFVAAGLLLNVLTSLRNLGRQVVVVGANEMIVSLFLVMGVNQVATLVRNKQH